jgi:hypothetical protein
VRSSRVRAAPDRPKLGRLDLAAATVDTFFVVTSGGDWGVGVSHRAGKPGFVHVAGDTLTIPDYPGNRYFNTLGNLTLAPAWRCSSPTSPAATAAGARPGRDLVGANREELPPAPSARGA